MRSARIAAMFGSVALVAGSVAACSSGGSDAPTQSGGKVTLTVATFNEFGYEELVKEYMAAQPERHHPARRRPPPPTRPATT
ncbi:MAG: hypothetical protein V9F04_05665 [Dermatophilaceae bacterium]